MAEKISLTEDNPSSDLGDDYDDYKCSLCINFLKKPIISKCDHHFCHQCIKSWLQKNETCPICKEKLSMDSDTFVDKYTEYKIDQLRINCPNAKEGCPYQMPVDELEEHTAQCTFSIEFTEQDGTFLCPFSRMGCEATFASKKELQEHKQNFIKYHLTLAMRRNAALERKEKATNLEKEKQLIVNKCNSLVPVLNMTKFVWVVPDINEKVKWKETFPTKFWSKIPDGYEFTVKLSFKNNIAKIAIFIDKDSYYSNLRWPCKILSCEVFLLRDLTRQTEGSFTTEVRNIVIEKTNLTSKNIIELLINADEIKNFAIDNKLYVKIYMNVRI